MPCRTVRRPWERCRQMLCPEPGQRALHLPRRTAHDRQGEQVPSGDAADLVDDRGHPLLGCGVDLTLRGRNDLSILREQFLAPADFEVVQHRAVRWPRDYARPGPARCRGTRGRGRGCR